MDIQSYISSGIIERYLLGELSDVESAKVLALSKKHPEIKTEIELAEFTMMGIVAKTPPPKIKKAILSEINNEDAKVIPLHPKKFAYKTWLAAASIALLIGSAVYNFILINKLKLNENKLYALNLEKDKSNTALAAQSQLAETMSYQLDILRQAENTKIILKGLDANTTSLATIYWNQNSKAVFLDIHTLPIPKADQQYQLWAIVDGKPIDAGVIETFSDSNVELQKMKSINGAQAFAVTLEKKGGSPTPKLSAICLLGNV